MGRACDRGSWPQLDGDEVTQADALVVKAEGVDDQWDQPDQFSRHDEGSSDESDLQLDQAFDAAFAAEPQSVAPAEAEPVRGQFAERSFKVEAMKRGQPEDMAPEAALEMSLEAELNALLGNTPEAASSSTLARPVQATNRLAELPALRGSARDAWHEQPPIQLGDEPGDSDFDAEPVDAAPMARRKINGRFKRLSDRSMK